MALLVSPLGAAGDDAPALANAADYQLAACAGRAAGLPWRSVAWGVPVDVAETGHGLAPHLGAAALAALRDDPEFRRVVVTHRSSPAMAGAWNRLPAAQPAGTGPGFDLPSEDFVAPRSPEEQTIAGIWQEVLGTQRIGRYDNFFELGGDSLIATQIHARIGESFDVEMPVEKLFELPTVEAQARAVEELRADEEKRDQEEILAILAEMSDEEAAEALVELSE